VLVVVGGLFLLAFVLLSIVFWRRLERTTYLCFDML